MFYGFFGTSMLQSSVLTAKDDKNPYKNKLWRPQFKIKSSHGMVIGVCVCVHMYQ